MQIATACILGDASPAHEGSLEPMRSYTVRLILRRTTLRALPSDSHVLRITPRCTDYSVAALLYADSSHAGSSGEMRYRYRRSELPTCNYRLQLARFFAQLSRFFLSVSIFPASVYFTSVTSERISDALLIALFFSLPLLPPLSISFSLDTTSPSNLNEIKFKIWNDGIRNSNSTERKQRGELIPRLIYAR